MILVKPKVLIQFLAYEVYAYCSRNVKYSSEMRNIAIKILPTVESRLLVLMSKQSIIPYSEIPLKGLRLGTVGVENSLIRGYDKHEPYDFYPLLGLYYSEICKLVGKDHSDDTLDSLNVTMAEIEWAHKEEMRHGIITGFVPLKAFKLWYKYSTRQKEILSILQQREEKTRHKDAMVRHTPSIDRVQLLSMGFVQ